MKAYFVVLFIFCLFSCRKKEAQLPANKIETKSQIQSETLRTINQEMVLLEDSFLHGFISGQDSAFNKHDSGFYYKKLIEKTGETPKEHDECLFKYSLCLIDGTVLENAQKNVTIGKKEIPVGLEEGLLLMREGEKAIFYLPSSIAYRMKGYEHLVPPYTSVRFEVELMKVKTTN
ncbi:MAG: FKBP-type peptidyl-prolyl cis-trans isomerase [Prevotellaceae bacterium]|nr:FKBP-type peptidyl-prolyl cis-trans isomerase [Prevotellaceae bacterium]